MQVRTPLLRCTVLALALGLGCATAVPAVAAAEPAVVTAPATSGLLPGLPPGALPSETLPAGTSSTKATQKTVKKRTVTALHLRAKASASSRSLAIMPRGTTLTQLATHGRWIKVRYHGRTGWASGTYLRTVATSTGGAKATTSKKHPTAPRKASDYRVLVNKKHPLQPLKYAPKDLRSVDGARVRSVAADPLRRLFSAARRAGAPLRTVSSYRSYSYQAGLYRRYVRQYGSAYASRIAAKPGTSEHQTGLTVDVGTPSGAYLLSTSFSSTRQSRWVATNAWKYGYIVRYQKGQEKVTGYMYEPWHLRYVGKDIAKTMHTKKLRSLEAYYGTRG